MHTQSRKCALFTLAGSVLHYWSGVSISIASCFQSITLFPCPCCPLYDIKSELREFSWSKATSQSHSIALFSLSTSRKTTCLPRQLEPFAIASFALIHIASFLPEDYRLTSLPPRILYFSQSRISIFSILLAAPASLDFSRASFGAPT